LGSKNVAPLVLHLDMRWR